MASKHPLSKKTYPALFSVRLTDQERAELT